MKSLNKFISRFMWMILACLIFSACSEDEKWEDAIEEGLPVSLKFNLTTPAPNEIQTRATDEQETKVEKLALFFYKDENSRPLVYEVPQTELETHTGNGTHYMYSISVPESVGLTSGTWYLYAVANWDKGFWDSNLKLSDLETMNKTQMDKYCILKKYKTADITETSILLSGKYGDGNGSVTFQWTPKNKGVNTLKERIHLKRSIAKIIFKFINGEGVNFVPQTFDIYNYCRTSTLMERDGWEGIANPGSLQWKGVEAKDNFVNSIGVPIPKDGIMFYMPENVQKPLGSPENKAMREKKKKNGKGFKYAPENASYLVVHGKYEGPGKDGQGTAIGNVDYTIHFGDFSEQKTNPKATGRVDNFTVRRNSKYTFTVKVNGVNNIILEAETSGEPDGSTENQPGAEGDILNADLSKEHKLLDSHYETCIIKIPVSAITGRKYGLILKTPYSNFTTNEIKQGDLTNKDVNWIEFCKPASATETVAYPGKDALVTPKDGKKLFLLPELLEKLYYVKNNQATQYEDLFLSDGENIYVQAFVNEYFYDDKVGELEKFINAPNRIMTVAGGAKISTDGNSTYISTPLFTIEQRSIKSMYNLAVAQNPFGIECTEDGGKSYFVHDWSTNVSNGAYNDKLSGTSKDDGRANYFGNFPKGAKWSDYVDYANNTMKQDNGDNKNYGMYQAILRNRDLNGNGIIDAGEMRWFVPSVNQHIAIWNGYHALTEEARLNKGNLYYTSTQGDFRTMWAQEGAFGHYKTGDEGGKELVRCIRALKHYNLPTSRSTTYNPNTRIFTVSGFGPNAVRKSGSHKGEYIYHSQFDPINKLPEAFQMAKSDLGVTVTPGNPGKTFVPTVGNITTKSSEYLGRTYYTATLDITSSTEGHSYYMNTEPSLVGSSSLKKLNNITTDDIAVIGSITGNITVSPVYILAENGNYVKITFDKETKKIIAETPVVLPQNKPSEGGTIAGEPTKFTLDQIAYSDVCANYSEEPDGSDKGQWRVPNQRELMIMLMLSTNTGGGTDYSLAPTTASRTYYDRSDRGPKNGLFFIQTSGGFITSQEDRETGKTYVVRPVRDAQPEKHDSTPSSADSSYRPGGDVIK